MLTTLLLFLQLSGTVDRIEGNWAIVEWTDGSFTDVPLTIFPRLPREGDSFSIRLKPSHSGLAIAPRPPARISTSAGLIELPTRQKTNQAIATESAFVFRRNRLSVSQSTSSRRT